MRMVAILEDEMHRGLEQIKSDSKGENDRLKNEGGGGEEREKFHALTSRNPLPVKNPRWQQKHNKTFPVFGCQNNACTESYVRLTQVKG